MTKVTGFGLIGTAVTVIIYSIPGFPKIETSLGPLFPVALLIFFTIENLMKKDYKSSLISALIGLMIANAIYDLLPIPYSYRNSDCFRYPSRPRIGLSLS